MPLLTARSYYPDRLGRVHGPMRFENGYFTDGGWRWGAVGVAEGEMRHNLDLLTECDRIGNPRREDIEQYQEETGWVIELGESEPSRPAYWTGPSENPAHWPFGLFSDDNLKAVRFARKEDAQAVANRTKACAHDDTRCHFRIADHMWCGSQPSNARPWFLNLRGIQPVGDDVLVDVETRSEFVLTDKAGKFDWRTANPSSAVITAYRLHVAEMKGEEAYPEITDAQFAKIAKAVKKFNGPEADAKRTGVTPASDPVPVGAGDGVRYADHENREIAAKLLEPRYPKIAGMIRAGLRSTNDPNYLVDPGLLLDLLELLAARKAGE